ncbi:MAG: UvrD-helicase domain-containing protein, partial [Bacteroidales bacterium]|nr:UvrD-helicase domain-containing protein [Candidatus Cryptobacteroides aphodequi]
LLIVAGAGSGKTRVLTSRIAWLLEQGIDPSRILALTFTKKAASEMKERIALMVGPTRARRLVMGTFHSVFIRFLRDYADEIGYTKDFTVYDQSDSISAIKTCIKELGFDDKVYKPKEVLSRISSAKNTLVLPEAYRLNNEAMQHDVRAKKPKLVDVYAKYQEKLKASDVMDFDDILVNMNILFKKCDKAWHEISDRFSYILVDEYQDTNYSQYLILRRLAYFHNNICVVGDDSQSIYAFRGARIENILKFKDDYKNSKIIRLERNYRSTSTIVDAANSVIEHNSGRIPKKCYSEAGRGESIHLLRCFNETEEAVLIAASIIDKIRAEHARYDDFAILYRTNSQSRAIEEVLRRRNLPYMIYSGNSFFERAEVRDFMAYLKLVVNPQDNESLKRAMGKPSRGIGDVTMNAIEAAAAQRGCSIMDVCRDPGAIVRDGTATKLKGFAALIDGLHGLVANTDACVLAKKVGDDSGLYAFYKADTSIEGLSRTANLEELINSVATYVDERRGEDMENNELPGTYTLADFLENVSLLSNVDTPEDEDDSNRIALMTVHSAKGLEFPYVYIAGMEENLFPSGGMMALAPDIEEERRLFYVALTRAKSSVVISFASERMRNGQHNSNPPSRFLGEIDPCYLDNPLSADEFEVQERTSGFGIFGPQGFRGYGRSTDERRSSFAGRYGQSGPAVSEKRFGQGGSGSRFGQGSPSASGSRFGSGGSSRPGFGQGSPSASGSRFGLGGPSGASRPGTAANPTASSRPGVPAGAAAKPAVIDANFIPVPMAELYEGERIEHNRFGAGLIVSISGVMPELKAVIDFDAYGTKTLLLKYAKLRPERK